MNFKFKYIKIVFQKINRRLKIAAHIETGTMVSPNHYSSKQLDNLGLIAAMYDELGIGELIDQLIPQNKEKRNISIGQAVKAMVLNGLGFSNKALYLTPFFSKINH